MGIRAVLAALLIAGTALIHSSLHAGDNTVPTAQDLESWSSFVAKLAPLEQRMLDKIPAHLRDDPAVRQRAWRLLLMATARTAIDALVGDRRHPMFVPEINLAINLYQPNADTIYKSALIEPEGTYRITGNRGTILFAKLGQLGPDMLRTGQPSAPLSYLDLDDVADQSGRFSVVISPEKPTGYDGHWWQLDPKAIKLMLRQVGYDWANELDTSIAIERLDTPAAKPVLDPGYMSDALAELPNMIGNASTFFVDHVDALRKEGYINKLKVFDVSQMSGLVGQCYYEGAYDIRNDEALIVSVKVPDVCKYWSLILTNDLYETTDWYNNHSSLNGAQAKLDADGYFRAVISARDPGVHNWLDTAGFTSGAIQGRWLDCSGTPMPDVQKVAIDDVRKHLPADTALVSPAQRDEIIRARRAAFQQRRLW